MLEVGNQLDAFGESSIEDMNYGRVESHYNEEQSLVNALSPARRAGRAAVDFSTPASQNMRMRAQDAATGQRRAVGVTVS